MFYIVLFSVLLSSSPLLSLCVGKKKYVMVETEEFSDVDMTENRHS